MEFLSLDHRHTVGPEIRINDVSNITLFLGQKRRTWLGKLSVHCVCFIPITHRIHWTIVYLPTKLP